MDNMVFAIWSPRGNIVCRTPIMIRPMIDTGFYVLNVYIIILNSIDALIRCQHMNNCCRKGPGYHLDLFVLAITIVICSTLGLPWFVAATVRSITHLKSLVKQSETSAPGETPTFEGIR